MDAEVGFRQVVRFDVFEVDPLAHELRKSGCPIHLQEQPYRLLMILLERPGQVVTRDELRRRLWPQSVIVDFDHGVNNSVARLREVFGDDATQPRYIVTVPRVGYRFVAPLREFAAAAAPASAGDPAGPPSGPARWAQSRTWLVALIAAVVGAAIAAWLPL